MGKKNLLIIIDDNVEVSKQIDVNVKEVFDDCYDEYDHQMPKNYEEYETLKKELNNKNKIITKDSLIIIDIDLNSYKKDLNYTDFIEVIENKLNGVKPILILTSYNLTSGVLHYIDNFNINVFPKEETSINKEIFKKFLFKIRRDMGLFPLTMLTNDKKTQISIKDKKNFLSLFSYENQYFEIGKLSDKLHFIPTIEEKIFREIDKGILSLKETNRSTIRTITMLLGLKKYFQSNETRISKLEKDSNIELTDKNNKKWKLSFPLLVVKAVQFSQLEWENQDYCFEHFSAIRAEDEIKKLLKLFFNNNNDNDKNIETILDILYNLIRWQTIYGQLKRGSAELSIENIISQNIKTDNKEIFDKMLIAVSYADEFLKYKKSYNEKIIESIVLNGNINQLLRENDSNKLEDVEINNQEEDEKILYKQHDKGFIWSHLRHPKIDQLKNCIKNKLNHEKVNHIIFNKKQRSLGLLHKIGLPEDKWKKYRKTISISISNNIETFLVTFEPCFVAEKLYLTNNNCNNSSIKSLNNAFEIIINSQDTFKLDNNVTKKMVKRLTLPMVKRITDLLEFFPEYHNSNLKVFKATILFDKGKDKVEIWLPKIKNIDEKENCTIVDNTIVDKKLALADILLRYLQFVVLNYGMTKGFYHVDYDFSQLDDKEMENKWKEYLTQESGEIESTYKKLGAHVFYRYLTDCGSEIIDTTFSRQKYLDALTPRKMTEIYKFDKSDKPDITEIIKDKYIMGIDIGATGVKIGFFEIIDNNKIINNNQYNNCYQLCYINDQEYYLGRCAHLNFIMPIISPEMKKKGEDKYKDAEDFAEYVLETMKKKIETMLKKDKKDIKDILNKIICIGLCWPGPIKQNRIASTSGILKNFKSFSGKILENDHNKIINLDISKAFSEIFNNKINKNNKSSNNIDLVTVSLTNDGDAEAAGVVFGTTNKKNSAKKEFFESLFNNHSVAVIKMGTGTAGSVIVNGSFVGSNGINEFGKLIVNLAFDNSKNAEKKEDERFPQGDANKFFSFNFIYNQMKEVINHVNNYNDHNDTSIKVITGHDLALLLEDKGSDSDIDKQRRYKLFGALELISLTAPYIEWKNLVNEENGYSIKDNIFLIFEDNHFTISENNNNEDRAYCDELYDSMKKSNYDDNKIEEILFNNNKSLSELLEKLGKYRIDKRLKINESKFKEYQEYIKFVCKNLGAHLADIVALLYDIYNLKAVIIAGGIIKDDKIGELCIEGFKIAIEKYIHDNFHTKDNKNLIKEIKSLKNTDHILENKLLYHIQKSNEALLGTAMLGFDHFITENKIKELKAIAKMKNGNIAEKCTFLTKDEAKNFMKVNAGDYRISIDDDGEIHTLLNV